MATKKVKSFYDAIKYSFTQTSTNLIMKKTNSPHGYRKQPRKHVYVYHWDRIIGAGVLFLVLVGWAGYGLFFKSDSSPKKEVKITETQPEAADSMEETRPKPEEDKLPPAVAERADSNSNPQNTQTPPAKEALTAEDHPAQQSVETKDLEIQPSSPETIQLSNANHTNEGTEEKKLVSEKERKDSESANAAPSSEKMAATPVQEELSEPQAEISQNLPMAPQEENLKSADTTFKTDAPGSHFQLKNIKILMPVVKRFLLSGSISNREPKGELNEISFTDGSAAVWAFSEITNQKGSRLKYVWLHDGHQIATVPVKVGSNRWRSYSSKIINQSMSGAWRVELQDSKNRLMAGADFFLE